MRNVDDEGEGMSQAARRSASDAVPPAPAVRTGPAAASILGVRFSVVDESALLTAVRSAVRDGRPTVFVGLYAALFRRLADDPEYRDLIDRSATYPDGFGVVRELHKRGVAHAMRLATTDMVYPLSAEAARQGWRIVMFGARPGVAERAARALEHSTPGVEIVGIWDGYSGGPSVDQLREARADIALIAIGAPAQEQWAFDVAVPAGVPAIMTCGGLFDFMAGDKRRAPAWMQRAGLEWLFRVLLEPRRLIRRYLEGNLYFLRRARRERLAAALPPRPTTGPGAGL
jgi:N-acetylglucosaminyldiphosphoundecaprenol N-acetyl-beta-D-mannosaminyltransferase